MFQQQQVFVQDRRGRKVERRRGLDQRNSILVRLIPEQQRSRMEKPSGKEKQKAIDETLFQK